MQHGLLLSLPAPTPCRLYEGPSGLLVFLQYFPLPRGVDTVGRGLWRLMEWSFCYSLSPSPSLDGFHNSHGSLYWGGGTVRRSDGAGRRAAARGRARRRVCRPCIGWMHAGHAAINHRLHYRPILRRACKCCGPHDGEIRLLVLFVYFILVYFSYFQSAYRYRFTFCLDSVFISSALRRLMRVYQHLGFRVWCAHSPSECLSSSF